MLHVITEEPILVRYGETDQMGHAYYGSYMLWFEQSRGAWCRDRGFTYQSLEEKGYKLPVVELHVKYHSEIKYDDLIFLRVKLAEIKRAAVKFEYEIYNNTTQKITTYAYSWHIMIGTEPKAVTIPEDIRTLMLRDPKAYARMGFKLQLCEKKPCHS